MYVKLSKTRFIAGRQCELRLWNDVHRRDLATAWSDTQQAIFDRGTRIGELAQARYPGGVLVGYKPWEREPAIAETQRLMADESVPAIYEAAIEHRGLYARVDVLLRNGPSWDLIEVKGSTRPDKEVFLQDVAVQYWGKTSLSGRVEPLTSIRSHDEPLRSRTSTRAYRPLCSIAAS